MQDTLAADIYHAIRFVRPDSDARTTINSLLIVRLKNRK